MLKEDKILQADVIRELSWEPGVTAAHIGVTASDGSITLRGTVADHGEKVRAVEAATRAHGVRAVADELEIEPREAGRADDAAIAEAIAHVLRWDDAVPESVDATVSRGWVTLKGKVEWPGQREAARKAVQHIAGIQGITNDIVVTSRPKPADLERRIEEAFARMANLDAQQIRVTMSDGTAHLDGHVHSLWEAKVARNAVMAVPGVTTVDDRLKIGP